VSLDDAVAVAERDEPRCQETLRAVTGYREAMTYVAAADDAYFEWDESLCAACTT
jgi:hypothetical protein